MVQCGLLGTSAVSQKRDSATAPPQMSSHSCIEEGRDSTAGEFIEVLELLHVKVGGAAANGVIPEPGASERVIQKRCTLDD